MTNDADVPQANDRGSLQTAEMPASTDQLRCAIVRVWQTWTRGSRLLLWIGFVLLAGWTGWAVVCLSQKPLARAVPIQHNYYNNRFTYVLEEPFIGLDFHHNYVGARTWRSGADPYAALSGDPANLRYVYPPLTLVAFAWTDLFPPGPAMSMTAGDGTQKAFATSEPAIFVWLIVTVAVLVYAAWMSWFERNALGLNPIPLPFAIAALLVSYPVLFELERGNCNALPLLAVIILIKALSWPKRERADVVIGLCVAAAVGIKPYAIVLLPGLLTLRRFRAAGYTMVWLLVQAVVFSPELRHWRAVAVAKNQTTSTIYMDWSHSLIAPWQLIWRDLGIPALAQLPAQIVVGAFLIGVCAVVGLRVYSREATPALAWPYLLWLCAVGTMLIPEAYDYNLLFIPLTVLATWSSQDSWRIHVCGALVVLWCQPFFFGLSNLPLLLLKVGTALLVGALVIRRSHAMRRRPWATWSAQQVY